MVKKILMVAFLGFAVSFVACGDDDGDDGPDTADFTGVLIDFGSKNPVQGITVSVLDNSTGQPLAGFTPVTTGIDGGVAFTGLPAGKVGFLAAEKAGTPGYVNTYQFNIDAGGTGETLWAVDAQTYQLAPAAAGLQLVPGKAQVAGGFYWTKTDGDECPVCEGTIKAIVGGSETGEIRYFSDGGMPTTIDNQASLNEANGFYLAANIAVGKVEIQGLDPSGTKVGSTGFTAFADSITISNVYVDEGKTANPGNCASADCQ